ncbi:hypothetical protein KKD70_01005 [Patescibacteria group bacterium]|nr:hypothetical protein [Patescibacteria group bacterium]
MPPKKAITNSPDRSPIIRYIYLYLISAITFITFIIGAVGLVDIALKTFVFQIEDDYFRYQNPVVITCEKYILSPDGEEIIENLDYETCVATQKANMAEDDNGKINPETARDLSIGIAQILVAFPLWIFHWRIIERDRKRKKITK